MEEVRAGLIAALKMNARRLDITANKHYLNILSQNNIVKVTTKQLFAAISAYSPWARLRSFNMKQRVSSALVDGLEDLLERGSEVEGATDACESRLVELFVCVLSVLFTCLCLDLIFRFVNITKKIK